MLLLISTSKEATEHSHDRRFDVLKSHVVGGGDTSRPFVS